MRTKRFGDMTTQMQEDAARKIGGFMAKSENIQHGKNGIASS